MQYYFSDYVGSVSYVFLRTLLSHSFVIDFHTHSASWAIWILTASEHYSSS